MLDSRTVRNVISAGESFIFLVVSTYNRLPEMQNTPLYTQYPIVLPSSAAFQIFTQRYTWR